MKHQTTAAALLLASLALSAPASHADGLRFFPGLESGFKYEPTLALTAGVMKAASVNDDTMAAYGLDFNLNCGLIQTPDNRVRTHLQINHVDKSGLKSTSFELSPRYTLPLGNGFSLGAGPAVALVRVDNGTSDKNLFGYGVAAGANFRQGVFYSGVDLRYLNTNEREHVGLENWLLLAKVGINF